MAGAWWKDMQFEGVQTAVDEVGSTPDALAAPNPSRRASHNQAEASTAEPGERVLAGRVADGRRQELSWVPIRPLVVAPEIAKSAAGG
jgi:hypothetical protein